MKAIKILFIWLLMAFIPLQGMAANALLVCKAANQPPATEMHAHPCADMQASQDDTQDTRQDGGATCVAQYAGVPWMPASGLSMPPEDASRIFVSYAEFPILSFVPEGPERPPRRLFL